MKTNALREQSLPQAKAAGAKRRAVVLAVLLLTGLVLLAAGGLWWHASRPGEPAAAGGPIPVRPSAFAPLQGVWQRPDGGYVLQIGAIDGNGVMDAGYFNPNPIHVARAQASVVSNAVKVFVELRDVNYPGATYRLTYLPKQDQLAGLYHQPLMGQTFEVVFQRLQP